MSDPYQTLGVSADADDTAIRRRYLELTREFPPERHPEKFATLRAAYEKIRTIEDRAKYHLFAIVEDASIDTLIEETRCTPKRTRVKLTALIQTICQPG